MNDIEEKCAGHVDELYDFINIVRHIAIDMDTTPVGDALSSEIPEDMKDL